MRRGLAAKKSPAEIGTIATKSESRAILPAQNNRKIARREKFPAGHVFDDGNLPSFFGFGAEPYSSSNAPV